MYNYSILVVDDNKAVTTTLKIVFRNVFEKVMVLNSPIGLSKIAERGTFDAILLDMNYSSKKLDGEEGLNWLRRIKSYPNSPAVILITAFADVPLAVQGLKDGAEDFVTKPWDNEDLVNKIVKAIEKRKQTKTAVELEKTMNELKDEKATLEEKLAKDKLRPLESLEREHIEEVLAETKYNLTQTANILGLTRQTLYNKAKKYGLIGKETPTGKDECGK